MVTVIVVDIEERVGERAILESVAILAVGTHQLRNTAELLRLNLYASILYDISFCINLPYTLRTSIGWRHHEGIVFGLCYRTHIGAFQVTGKELVEGLPVGGILIPALGNAKGVFFGHDVVILLTPAIFCIKIGAPCLGKFLEP